MQWYDNLKVELGRQLMERWRRQFNLPAPKPKKPTSEDDKSEKVKGAK